MQTRLVSPVRVCVILALLATLALSGLLPFTARAQTGARAPAAPIQSSLIFVENLGQFAEGARFQVRTHDYIVWLAEDAIWLSIPQSGEGANVKLSFPGANVRPRIEAFNRLETRVSYLAGSDPAEWRAGVPAWGGVRYANLYPGIDLEIVGEGSALVPRVSARPGADLGAVRLRVEGAREVNVDGGALQLGTATGPVAWPLLLARGATAEAALIPAAQGVFEVTWPFTAERQPQAAAPADDPTSMVYGTFLGGSGEDRIFDIALDESGAVYVAGETWSSDLPTTPGAPDTSYNFGYADAFVAKVNVCGSSLEYATYLGGRYGARAHSIAVDGSGAAYITGDTWSDNFPVTSGAFDTIFNGGADVFVAKLNPSGLALVYATYLGGIDDEAGTAIAVDDSGAAFVTGHTLSSYFPTTDGAPYKSYGGAQDVFVAKLSPDGKALDYATFLGGSGQEAEPAIAIDGSGAAYVTGNTGSGDFPTTPDGPAMTLDEDNAFVVKLNTTGSALDYAILLGGTDEDVGNGITVDGSGTAYIIGDTWSNDFPVTPGAYDNTFGDCEQCRDAFVVKLNPTGTSLDYATFLGGNARERGEDIVVDGSGSAYLTGATWSSDFPTTPGAFDTTHNLLNNDAFVAKLNATATDLEYGSFLGASGNEWGYGIALDGSGAVYVAGETGAGDFPTTSAAFDTSYNGGIDGFVAKIATSGRTGYCITGHVADTRGLVVPGVIVLAGAGGSAKTDTSGNYAIGNVLEGPYTLTPEFGACTFEPLTRTVEVPPDVAGQDFQLLPLQIYLPMVMRND